jgi:6-phosphogluconate dehydrogenase
MTLYPCITIKKHKEEFMSKADIGLIGLAVMGENLCLNFVSKGYSVAVYNRNIDLVERFVKGRGRDKKIIGSTSLAKLVDNIKPPRKVMLMIKSGDPVDQLIDRLLPYLDKGDIIIDGGNSNFHDTARRVKYVEEQGLLYIGTGVSGGEEGALKGPSIMPGGSFDAWDSVKDMFNAVSAKADDGIPCCNWIGGDGSGHFVKTIHNGIEYGDMQLICEVYHIMREHLGMSVFEIHEIFKDWNRGELESYLIEITADILVFKDTDGAPLVDKILDKAGQKGTGKWALKASLDLGIPLTLIGEAVWARSLSAQKDERVCAAGIFGSPIRKFSGTKEEKTALIDDLRNALFAAKIISYAQGFSLIQRASRVYGWNINCGEVAMIWRGGCIIRSAFLTNIKDAFMANPNLENLLLNQFFKDILVRTQDSFRRTCSVAVLVGIPIPALSSALAYFDGYRTENLPSNLLQAKRDYFGAHTYQRIDKPLEEFFHTNWTGEGGDTSARRYTI